MKFLLAAFALAAVALARPDGKQGHYHLSQNVTELIAGYGYPVQNFTVQTEDGYLLDVIRIPGGVDYRPTFESLQHQQRGQHVRTDKPAVFLMHGLLSSCEDFVIGGPTEGLAFYLAEHGYDVYLGNARGSTYGRKHTTLNPEKDAAFWRFCWTHIGTKDLPAMIDEVLRVSGQEQLQYIGHMQGTTVFYVMAAELPAWNSKIAKMISLGPIAYMKNASNEMYQAIVEHIQSKPWLLKNLGQNEFHPSNEFMAGAGQSSCVARGVPERICQNPFYLLNGYGSDQLNTTTAERYAQRLPAGASTRQVLHYAQLYKSGRFEKFADELKHFNQLDQPQGQQQQQQQHPSETEEFALDRITTPVGFIYSGYDQISTKEGVQHLKQKLPHVVRDIELPQCKNNLDLLFGKNVHYVYEAVYNMLKN